ncbi:hypothetical protein D3C73_1436060 [compost metagenome]
MCTVTPVFHLQDVGQDVGNRPIKLKRNLLIHLGGVINRACQLGKLNDFNIVFCRYLADIQCNFIRAFSDNERRGGAGLVIL